MWFKFDVILGIKTTKICGTTNIRCYQSAERKLFGENIVLMAVKMLAPSIFVPIAIVCQHARPSSMTLTLIEPNSIGLKPKCRIDFIWAHFSGDIFLANLFSRNKKKRFISNVWFLYFSTQPSNVEIFFRDHQVTMVKRTEVYTVTNFVAICGGLLGLFMGISVLSIIEFIYFSTLRLYWSLQQWRTSNAIVPFERKIVNSIFIDIPNAWIGWFRLNHQNCRKNVNIRESFFFSSINCHSDMYIFYTYKGFRIEWNIQRAVYYLFYYVQMQTKLLNLLNLLNLFIQLFY